jgi:hypothetical protein
MLPNLICEGESPAKFHCEQELKTVNQRYFQPSTASLQGPPGSGQGPASSYRPVTKMQTDELASLLYPNRLVLVVGDLMGTYADTFV